MPSAYLITAFLSPIVLVLILVALNRYLNGSKMNILGTVLTILGGVHTMDLGFLPDGVESALIAGAGIACLIVSKKTDRAQ